MKKCFICNSIQFVKIDSININNIKFELNLCDKYKVGI